MATGPALCERADEITAEWMRQALAAGGAPGLPTISGLSVEDLGSATNAFGTLLRCHLTTDGDSAAVPASVIVKLPTANPTAFRFARWLAMHERECLFYRRLARQAPIRSPRLLYGDFDESTHRFVLVLEDLRDLEVPPRTGVEAGRARRAVREIARLHGHFWGAVDDPALAACPDVLGPRFGRLLQTAYLVCLPVVLERFGECFSAATRRLAEALGPRVAAHFAAVAAGPRTLVHGDYRGENMFFRADDDDDATAGSVAGARGEARDDFAVVDWQGCGLGAGLYDVAYFLGANVAIDDRRRIEREALGEYHDIVCRLGAEDFTFDDCWRGYRRNMLGVLVPLILGAGGLDLEDRRLRDLVRSGLERTLAAVEDLDAGECLPAPGGFLTADRFVSTLSRVAYRMYGVARRLRRGAGGGGRRQEP